MFCCRKCGVQTMTIDGLVAHQEVHIEGRTCPDCRGTGHIQGIPQAPACYRCDGSGRMSDPPTGSRPVKATFGIGRIPADSDDAHETTRAQIASLARPPAPVASQPYRCRRCGRPLSAAMAMHGSFGTVCPDCYDDD